MYHTITVLAFGFALTLFMFSAHTVRTRKGKLVVGLGMFALFGFVVFGVSTVHATTHNVDLPAIPKIKAASPSPLLLLRDAHPFVWCVEQDQLPMVGRLGCFFTAKGGYMLRRMILPK